MEPAYAVGMFNAAQYRATCAIPFRAGPVIPDPFFHNLSPGQCASEATAESGDPCGKMRANTHSLILYRDIVFDYWLLREGVTAEQMPVSRYCRDAYSAQTIAPNFQSGNHGCPDLPPFFRLSFAQLEANKYPSIGTRKQGIALKRHVTVPLAGIVGGSRYAYGGSRYPLSGSEKPCSGINS